MTGPVLITGAAGFIGSALVRHLAGSVPVLALDLRPGPVLPGVDQVVADIRDP
ncbi:NAD-dependent epimerase/dehydratase family protein, partial [Acinetobacter baumannii]